MWTNGYSHSWIDDLEDDEIEVLIIALNNPNLALTISQHGVRNILIEELESR